MWAESSRRVLVLACAVLVTGQPVYAQSATPKRNLEDVNGPAQAAAAIGPYYALVIGNQDYEHVQHLATPEKDAKEIADLLHSRYGFTTKVLLNATRRDILGALVEYRRTLPPESNLLIYYAGHGAHDKDTDEAYWLPVDAEAHDNTNWISADDITSNMKAMPSLHVIVISDSCYSGVIKDSAMRGAHASIDPAETDRFFARVLRDKSRTILSSGGDEPVMDAGGSGHSIFAQALIEGLLKIDEDRFTASELYDNFLKRRVTGESDQQPYYSPLPRSGDREGDFVFTRLKVAPQPATPLTGYAAASELYRSHEYTAALTSFRAVAAGGDAKAMAVLGHMYSVGEGTAKNEQEAVRWYRASADAGMAAAMRMMGNLYVTGTGVKRDEAQAALWYRKAAEAGDVHGMINLARLDYAGDKKNYPEAAQWFRKAAETGEEQAMAELGFLYETGRGVPQDYVQAEQWYRRSAEKGYLGAMTRLGCLYLNGRGVPRDDAAAASWFRKASDGDPESMDELGVLYETGSGVNKDYGQAALWYRKAAARGYAVAMRHLGNLYLSGNGVEKDAYGAVTWFRKAADAGDLLGMDSLGNLYESGSGVAVDNSEAARWYRKAAEGGFAVAMRDLAGLYYRGDGMSRNYGLAAKWYQNALNAADGGSPVVENAIYADQVHGIAPVASRVAEDYRAMTEIASASAMMSLASMYENGQGVERSRSQALRLYNKAAALGLPDAADAVKRLQSP